MKMVFKSIEPTFAIKVSPKKNDRITNADCSSDNNNANVNPRVQQMNRTVNNVDDDNSNADLSDEDEEICAICQGRLGTEIE